MASDLSSLLSRVASGDREAFALFYDEWFPTVLAQARRAARGDEHEAEDIVQEVMMKLIRRTPIVETPAALGAWLRRAALTTARDLALSASRRRGRDAKAVAAAACFSQQQHAGQDVAERLIWLRRELAALDDEARDTLAQRFVLGRTLAQIGSVFGLSPGAVDGRIGRLLKVLRRRAEEASDEP